MAGLMLRCGCWISEDGEYVVGSGCRMCEECNTISRLHPFGNERIKEIKTIGR